MAARRHWLTFEVETVEQDSDGAVDKVWVDAFPLNPRMPCKVSDLSGRELIAAQAVQSKVTTKIETMYRPGFSASMRARDGATGEVWNIEAVIPDPVSRRRWVTLTCSRGVNEG